MTPTVIVYSTWLSLPQYRRWGWCWSRPAYVAKCLLSLVCQSYDVATAVGATSSDASMVAIVNWNNWKSSRLSWVLSRGKVSPAATIERVDTLALTVRWVALCSRQRRWSVIKSRRCRPYINRASLLPPPATSCNYDVWGMTHLPRDMMGISFVVLIRATKT